MKTRFIKSIYTNLKTLNWVATDMHYVHIVSVFYWFYQFGVHFYGCSNVAKLSWKKIYF